MTRHGLSVVVKLNPTLLGERDLRALLHDALGFSDVVVPAAAFARDPTPEQAFELIRRLQARAAGLGLRFGVKLTNTLVVENRRPFFPAGVKEAYLSGPPLHVLAMHLVARMREAFAVELPLSFSAGIDAHNVGDAIALDLVPVTVCTDWLKTGGYGRGIRAHEALVDRVRQAGATSRASFILRAFGHEERALAPLGLDAATAARALEALRGPSNASGSGSATATGAAASPVAPAPLAGARGRTGCGSAARAVDDAIEHVLGPERARRWVREAARLNTATYVARVAADPRYHRDHHEKPPKKLGTRLSTFDCLTCDKCVAVCPNDALFTYVAPHLEVPAVTVRPTAAGLTADRTGTLRIDERHQLASFADHCNDCGNCDAFCPEDGGPHLTKPRFFGSHAALRADSHGEGLFVERAPGGYRAHVRTAGREVTVEATGPHVRFTGDGFALAFDLSDPAAPVTGSATADVDLTLARIVHVLATSVLSPREVNPITALEPAPSDPASPASPAIPDAPAAPPEGAS